MIADSITRSQVLAFKHALQEQEKSVATIEKYLREVWAFASFLRGRVVTKLLLIAFREKQWETKKAQTVNGVISAINAYLEFAGLQELKMKLLRVQRRAFLDETRELTQNDYKRLLAAAKDTKNERLHHLMLTRCGTGIRVSELRHIASGLLCFLMIEGMLPVTAFARVLVDTMKTALLTLEYGYAGAAFSLYQVGAISQSGELSLREDIKNTYHVAIGEDQESWAALAKTLAPYAKRDSWTAAASGKTGADGNVYSYQVAEREVLPPTTVAEMVCGDYPLTLFTCTVGGQSRIAVRCNDAEACENIVAQSTAPADKWGS